MELQTWSGDFGLPTWDQKCLCAAAYAKFCGAPVTLRAVDDPFSSLPLLVDLRPPNPGASKPVGSLTELCKHLAERRFNADASLDSSAASRGMAVRSMVGDHLAPALAWGLWLDHDTRERVTRPWTAKRMWFPLSMYFPDRYKTKASDVVSGALGSAAAEAEPAVVAAYVASRAEEALTALSDMLGDEPGAFLLGPAPSSADALAFSYLAIMAKTPFPNQALSKLLAKYPKLETYVNRILTKYFPVKKSADSPGGNAGSSSSSNTGSSEQSDLDFSYLNAAVATAVAVGAMTGYAYLHGLRITFH